MPGRGTDLLAIPDPFWQRPETIAALRERAMGKLLLLIHQHTGASQTQIATACGTTQPKISDLIRGVQKIKSLAVFARYADALNMPDPARAILGVAPKATVSAGQRQARQREDDLPAEDVITAAADEVSAESLRLAAEFDPESLASPVAGIPGNRESRQPPSAGYLHRRPPRPYLCARPGGAHTPSQRLV